MEEDIKGAALGNVIRIDEERIRDHLGKIVRGSVEETLNALLEAEAGRLCNAGRYERSEARGTCGREAMNASCRPKPGRFASRSRSCASGF
jgi:putative transposase